MKQTHLNIEIKARANTIKIVEITAFLEEKKTDFKGIDHQIDTYFHTPNGRLKLRKGTIENNLIHYHRPDGKQPKNSHVTLYKTTPNSNLKHLLINALGIKTVVDKYRAIYFIDNVKFHLDTVKDLGAFIEIEAIDVDGTIGEEVLQQQCRHYMQAFGIEAKDLVACSYSDLLIGK